MALNKCLSRTRLFQRINFCHLCTNLQTNLGSDIGQQDKPEKKKAPRIKNESASRWQRHLTELNLFFDENPHLNEYKEIIPTKILTTKPYNDPDYLYLICPNIAKKVAEHILQRINNNVLEIAETSPGLGLLSKALLQKRHSSLRLYEINSEFYDYLQIVFGKRAGVLLYKKDLFTLWRYSYMDNVDKGGRVTQLLEGIPKKDWEDDPAIIIIGGMPKKRFLNYLIRSIILQRDLPTYGRVDLFLITYEHICKAFSVTTKDSRRSYNVTNILLQLFFESEIIDKFPRKYFLPWQTVKQKNDSRDYLYLLRITMRKDLPLSCDDFIPFYCFMRLLYGSKKNYVIATCEKWVPDCGQNLLLPKIKHEDYFENMDIFTMFHELSPTQLISVFRELSAHPNYPDSPFLDMVEQEWLRTETVETNLNDHHNKN